MDIRWTLAASSDLLEIFDTLSEKAPVQAARIVGEVYDSIGRLERFPEIGRAGRIDGTREFFVSPFVAVYRVEETAVVLLTVVHSAQLYPR
jgi:toxin ParE1/3/4